MAALEPHQEHEAEALHWGSKGRLLLRALEQAEDLTNLWGAVGSFFSVQTQSSPACSRCLSALSDLHCTLHLGKSLVAGCFGWEVPALMRSVLGMG